MKHPLLDKLTLFTGILLLLVACQRHSNLTPPLLQDRSTTAELVNGKANPQDAKFAVSIEIRDEDRLNHCSGSYLGDQIILTAAHCFKGVSFDAKISVYRTILSSQGKILVERIGHIRFWRTHPNYDSNQIGGFDLALARVASLDETSLGRVALANSEWKFNKERDLIFVAAGSQTLQTADGANFSEVREGQFRGQIYLKKKNSETKVALSEESQLESGDQFILNNPEPATENPTICSGDSGGGLLERNEDSGQLTLVGVLVATGVATVNHATLCNGTQMTAIPIGLHMKWIEKSKKELR